MKLYQVLLFNALLAPSLLMSWGSYSRARENVVMDLNQALAKTIASEEHLNMNKDTMIAFRSYLKTAELKDKAYLSLCSLNDEGSSGVCSDTLVVRSNGSEIGIRAYSNCTRAEIFGASNQVLPIALMIANCLWLMLSMRSRRDDGIGDLRFVAATESFVDGSNQPLALTPMQGRLMNMLYSAPGHRLSVGDICRELWPRKEDARETLYTLIRRTKPVIEPHGIRIVSEKGHFYKIEEYR